MGSVASVCGNEQAADRGILVGEASSRCFVIVCLFSAKLELMGQSIPYPIHYLISFLFNPTIGSAYSEMGSSLFRVLNSKLLLSYGIDRNLSNQTLYSNGRWRGCLLYTLIMHMGEL